MTPGSGAPRSMNELAAGLLRGAIRSVADVGESKATAPIPKYNLV